MRKGKLQDDGKAPNRRGTTVSFHHDPEILDHRRASSRRVLQDLTRSKEYLFGGSRSAGLRKEIGRRHPGRA